jgi:hypothetical protein
MKSERISIFNYEAFYLDHLEGNLGEEDTALLLAFLADHPELIVEEEEFILLDPKGDAPVFTEKDSLKIVNDDAVITLANAEHFLVAEAEGDLSSAKQAELNTLVIQHPHLEKERTYLAAMFLKADETIVYANKSGLKRKGAIVFWPYIALAAASVLIAFLVMTNNNSEESRMADNKEKVEKKALPKQEAPVQHPENVQIAKDEVQEIPTKLDNRNVLSPDRKEAIVRNPSPRREQLANVNPLKQRTVRKVINSVDLQDLQPVSAQITPPNYSITPENDRAQVAAPEMKNPIKPITTRIEKSLNTPVDFQTGKAANNSGAGFFLKIGKLEISRKKGKN